MGEKLGMIGLGKMGLALSKEMIADGHEVVGYDIDSDRMKMLEDLGGSRAASAKEIAEAHERLKQAKDIFWQAVESFVANQPLSKLSYREALRLIT